MLNEAPETASAFLLLILSRKSIFRPQKSLVRPTYSASIALFSIIPIKPQQEGMSRSMLVLFFDQHDQMSPAQCNGEKSQGIMKSLWSRESKLTVAV